MIVRDLRYGTSYIKRAYLGKKLIYLRGAVEFSIEALALSDIDTTLTSSGSNDIVVEGCSLFYGGGELTSVLPDDRTIHGTSEFGHDATLYVNPDTLKLYAVINSGTDSALSASDSGPLSAETEIIANESAELYAQTLMPAALANVLYDDNVTAYSRDSSAGSAKIDIVSEKTAILLAQPLMHNIDEHTAFIDTVTANSKESAACAFDEDIIVTETATLWSQSLMDNIDEDVVFDDTMSATSHVSKPLTDDVVSVFEENASLHTQPLMSSASGEGDFGCDVKIVSSRFNYSEAVGHIESDTEVDMSFDKSASNVMCMELLSESSATLSKSYVYLVGQADMVMNDYVGANSSEQNKYMSIDELSLFGDNVSADTMVWLYPIQTSGDLYVRQAYRVVQTDNNMEVK